MGQYYKPMILNKEKTRPVKFAYSHDFGSGLKLMEHSWMLNPFVGTFEAQLINNPQPVVWGGDYADEENFDSIPKRTIKLLIEDGNELEDLKKHGVTLYSMCSLLAEKLNVPTKPKALGKRFKYLVNHDKKVFVDKTKTPLDSDGWQIHALPLLTCEGNGRGGGDFHGESDLVGAWARDVISVESKKSDIPKGFTEITFDLKE